METEGYTMEEQCENLMNIVVESRKRFGKMCVDYEHKISLMENNILNVKLETISNYHFKPKQPIPSIDAQAMTEEIDAFASEQSGNQKVLQNLSVKLKNVREVISMLKQDRINKKAKEPLTAEVLLARAKACRN